MKIATTRLDSSIQGQMENELMLINMAGGHYNMASSQRERQAMQTNKHNRESNNRLLTQRKI